jgi:uncharacterized protein YjbI with pentapeptide repeats
MTTDLQRLTAHEVREVVAAFSEDTFTDPENLSAFNPPLARVHIAPEPNEIWANLDGLDLSGMPAQYRNFRGSYLERVNLTGAALIGISFRGAMLEDTTFGGATLDSVDFRGAKLKRGSFLDAKLKRVLLRGATLEWVGFLDATLDDVNFSGAMLEWVSFISTTLNEVPGIRQYAAPHSYGDNQIYTWLVDADGRVAESGTIVINQGCFTGTVAQARDRAQQEYGADAERLALALQTIAAIEQEMMQAQPGAD